MYDGPISWLDIPGTERLPNAIGEIPGIRFTLTCVSEVSCVQTWKSHVTWYHPDGRAFCTVEGNRGGRPAALVLCRELVALKLHESGMVEEVTDPESLVRRKLWRYDVGMIEGIITAQETEGFRWRLSGPDFAAFGTASSEGKAAGYLKLLADFVMRPKT